ncbi:adenylate/guanylate cyclase domain-containing protein [Algoriphagus sp.]|uniref:adenylate/guanylate cyclase domain-containing protein n=1 Tax=Algoriphagus sp. TaxID=1872435 RepID=UPI00391B047B
MSQELNRKQSVVFFSDIVGYTRLMGQDENAAFELMKLNLQTHQEIFGKYNGQIVKELGDGILGVFDTPGEALNASIEIQEVTKSHRKFELRIGMHSGDIILDHGDVFGDAVNQSSRIQSVGVPSSILISAKLHGEIDNDVDFKTVGLGFFSLKNVAKQVELFAVTNPPLVIPKRHEILANIKVQEEKNWKFWTVLGVVFILLLAFLYSAFWKDSVWEKEKSVAVLPFINLSGNPELDYFTDGLTENLIGQISKINSIKTIAYKTMAVFKNQSQSLDSISEALQVSTILKGTVEQLNSGYRFKLQLVDAKENKNIWTDEYTREGTDLTQLQNDIAREIAKILDVKLTAEESIQIGKGETTNAEAYDLLFKAKQIYNEGFEDPQKFFEASELLKKAIALDPNYALAYTILAKTYYQIAFDDPNGPWYDQSLEMSSKALELEPKLAEAYNAQGMVYYDQGQHTKAKNSFETALSFYPNLSDAIGNLATIQFVKGNLEEAIKLQTKSSKLGPISPIPTQNLGWTYKILGDFETAQRFFDNSLQQSKQAGTYELKAFSFIKEGKLDSAWFQAEKVKKMDYLDSKVLGYIYFYSNQLDSAYRYLAKEMTHFEGAKYPKYSSVPLAFSYLLKQREMSHLADSILKECTQVKLEAMSLGYEDYYLPLDLAVAYAVKNQPAESLKYLQIAYERGWRDTFFTEYNPIFAELKKDMRYRNIITQIQNDLKVINKNLSSKSSERER